MVHSAFVWQHGMPGSVMHAAECVSSMHWIAWQTLAAHIAFTSQSLGTAQGPPIGETQCGKVVASEQRLGAQHANGDAGSGLQTPCPSGKLCATPSPPP